MSVGFVYRSVWRMVPSRMTVVSREDTFSREHSAVNLMVGWKVFPVGTDAVVLRHRSRLRRYHLCISTRWMVCSLCSGVGVSLVLL